jgi:hypothetical protein
VIGVIKGEAGDGKTIMFRADLDGLPIPEEHNGSDTSSCMRPASTGGGGRGAGSADGEVGAGVYGNTVADPPPKRQKVVDGSAATSGSTTGNTAETPPLASACSCCGGAWRPNLPTHTP